MNLVGFLDGVAESITFGFSRFEIDFWRAWMSALSPHCHPIPHPSKSHSDNLAQQKPVRGPKRNRFCDPVKEANQIQRKSIPSGVLLCEIHLRGGTWMSLIAASESVTGAALHARRVDLAL